MIIVLGAHRSGTSALAGALTKLGYFPGARLMPPVDGVNNNGFFEDQRVADLNDDLFRVLDRDWRWPLPMPANWLSLPAMQPFRSRARALLQEQMSHPLWQIKDPRMCQTLPLWLAELDALGVVPNILLIVRDGREVIESLHQRDNMPREQAEAIWLGSVLDAERASRTLPRLLVPYAQLLDHSAGTLSAITKWLGAQPTTEQLTAAAAFVSKGQRNHQAAQLPALSNPDATRLNDWVGEQIAPSLKGAKGSKDNKRSQLEALNTSQASTLFAQLGASSDSALTSLQPLINAQASQLLHWEDEFAKALKQLEANKLAAVDFEQNAAISAEVARDQYDAHQKTVAIVVERDDELSNLQQQVLKLQTQLTTQHDEHELFRERAARVLGDQVLPPAEGNKREQSTNDYKGLINLQVENNAHTRVIRYLREHFSSTKLRVLEVGCSEGYFGAALKEDGHEVWGIETNAIAADIAETELDLVYRDSIEAFLLADQFLTERFDAIVFGDVLEHLLDPARILRAVSERLSTRGVIISSVPNVAHERVRMMLLEGRWEYSATGIMDNTHLHFFTRDNLVDLFSRANLSVERLSTIELTGEQVQIPVSPATEATFGAAINDRERNVFQFITLTQPDADAATKNIDYSLKLQHHVLSLPPLAESSLYSIRIHDPLQRHAELFGGETRLGPFGAPTDEQIEWADTFVLQREVNDEQLALVDHLQSLGKRVIFDIDDYLVEPPEYLSVYDHCMAMRPKLISMLQKADAVSVSTAPLQEKLAPYNDNVFLTPNYAWNSHPPIQHTATSATEASASNQRVRILVASSDSVRVDFLVPALTQIQARFDVDLVGIGPPGDYLRSVGLNIDTAPLMPHEQFKAFAASRDNTIALIPLDSNDFNACKSAVKYFDYALAGVPCICSDNEPYISAVEHKVAGVLCPNVTEDWVLAIENFLHNPQLRKETAAAAHAQVLSAHNLNLTAQAWQQMFTQTPFPDAIPGYSPADNPANIQANIQADKEPVPADTEHQESPENPEIPVINPDPVAPEALETSDQPSRTKAQLLLGTARHLMQPASWSSAWQIYKKQGLVGLKAKWKLVF